MSTTKTSTAKDGLSPYIGGALTGLAVGATALTSGKFFGATSSLVRSSGMVVNTCAPSFVAKNSYYQKHQPTVDWQWLFVSGIGLGSLLSALTSRSFKLQAVPDTWAETYGSSTSKRLLAAFVGGVISMFGARMAGGCPSGHGVSGSLQLSISGFLSVFSFFGGGMLMLAALGKRDKN
jgi:uncharacterized membrane protein YedE/YeeE